MKRRAFIAGLGGAAAWPFVARGQQAAMPVAGYLNVLSPEPRRLAAFLKGLQEAGYIDGHNVAIQYRWAENHSDRLPAMVAELVHSHVTVIAATTTPAALAARAATSTIPIVFETGGDPVKLGLVASLSRPGGNITGVTSLAVEVSAKELEVLHELIPAARVIGLLVNPTNPTVAEPEEEVLTSTAHALGLEIHVLKASRESDLAGVFAKLVELHAAGLVISADPFFTSQTQRLAALAVRYATPTVYTRREFPLAGGLVSYGSDIIDPYRLAGIYTGRILKGDKPADLPVQQTTKQELVINLKAAKALGISVPLPILGRADESIE